MNSDTSTIPTGKIIEVNHPFIIHKLTIMRDKTTKAKDFRELLSEIGSLMVFEITRDMSLKDIEIETPVAKTSQPTRKDRSLVIIPILRAGLGMVDGILKVYPTAKVGHIGLARNEETLIPTEYYLKFPDDVALREALVVDPMVATGGSLISAIQKVKEVGVKKIKVMSLIGTQSGLDKVLAAHPDVTIYIAKIDEYLNEVGYIVPGLGDCGDRLYGTKDMQ
jgi:uracil phosphoribosyltransferase